MTTAIRIMLIIHIVSGFVTLACGLFSMLNKKGARNHRLTGKIFFYGMTGVFITATFISLAKNIPFLFMVGFFSYYMACSGYRVLYLKKLHLQQKPAALDWLIGLIGIVFGIGLLIFSYTWFVNIGAWGSVPFSFGAFCLFSGIHDLRNFYVRPKNKQHWFVKHGFRMGGGFAAALTAFVVTNVSIGSLNWLLWLAPGLLTTVWTARIMRRYKAKFKKYEVRGTR